MNALLRSFIVAAFLALTLLAAHVAADTNAQRFARGLPPLAPQKRDPLLKRKKNVSAAPPQPTIYPVTNGGYAGTCKDISLGGANDHVISASCKRFDGGFVGGLSVNINKCFTNVGGHLACSSAGGASNSECNDCTLSGTVLTCKCLTGVAKPKRVATSIDTNTCLTNRNGKLMCY